jgi:PadR family transcriptional regulator AphA
MSTHQLGPTSYLVLGLLMREGPCTPYDLKRLVAAALGRFWSFPHALLYAEPPRLVTLGMATETREFGGRRRRTFAITDAGTDSLRAWLERPSRESTELRDPGLLQLFFADLGSSDAAGIIAREQLAIHEAKLKGYLEDQRLGPGGRATTPPDRTPKRWHRQSLRISVLYERAAVDFWEGVAAGTSAPERASSRSGADGDGVGITSPHILEPIAVEA